MLTLGGFRLPLARSALRLNPKRSARFDTGMMGFVEGLSLKTFSPRPENDEDVRHLCKIVTR